MLIDLRQHIITLVAVFLALAVGIVIGSFFINGSLEKFSGRLEKEFGKLRIENEQRGSAVLDLTEQLHRQQQFDRAIAPTIVDGKLAGHAVAIIQTGEYADATENVKHILQTAGAEIRNVTVLSVWDDNADTRAAVSIQAISGETGSSDPIGRALEILANSIVSGANPPALSHMESKGFVHCDGDYSRPTPCIVLVGGSKNKDLSRSQSVDAVLVEKLKAANAALVVGVESSAASTSYIPVYHTSGISTVDNVDQPMGQIGLIYVLLGEPGDFGVKKTAGNLVPKELENGQWAKTLPR